MTRSTRIAAIAAACLAAPALAQAPAAAPPAWQQGRSADQASSTLHPIAPILTGRMASELPVDKLKVPPGFKVEVWADGIPEARSLALGDKGTVFVSNRNLKDVYAVTDQGGKRTVTKVLKGLNSPNGVAFANGTLYVAERDRITAYEGIEDKLANPPAARVVIDNLDPTQQAGHFWKFLAMGPDGKLYYNVGSPGNIVMPAYYQATINRVDPRTGVTEIYARGVRNSVGFDWDPRTKELWFTNHARDWISDDLPHDTLHHAATKGMNFGYPFCHQGNLPDPEFGWGKSCDDYVKPAALLGPHAGSLGLKFYTGKMFPSKYQGAMFIAVHGPWNRTKKYNGVYVAWPEANGKARVEPFMTGFVENNSYLGRPVDFLVMKDGSLLVSDDHAGAIYRISYGGK